MESNIVGKSLLIGCVVLSSCNFQRNTKKEEDAARIEALAQEKADSIVRAKEEQNKQDLSERIDRELDRVRQERERIRKEKESSEVTLQKVVGTYKFDYEGKSRFECSPIVVLDDGRCVLLYQTLGGDVSPKLIGKVRMIADNVFTLNEREDFILDLKRYVVRNGEYRCVGNSYKWKWNFYDYLVFDLNEGRLYLSYKKYVNRDVEEADFAIITSHTSSTSLNQ